MNDRSVSTLARILEFATFSVRVEVAPAGATAAVQQVLASGGGETAVPAEVLAAAGEQLGLTVRVVRRSVDEAVRQAHEQAVWIAVPSTELGVQDSLAVVGSLRGKARVVRFSDTAEAETWSLDTLRKSVGAQSTSDPVEWVVAESARPLTQFANEIEDPHGHGSHTGEHHGVPPFTRLRQLLKAESHDLWVAVIYSAAIGILSLVVPVATQSLVNSVAFGTVLQPLVVLTAAVLIFLGFAALLQCLRTWIVELIQQRIFVRVATDVVYRLLRVQASAFDKHHGPELVNRFLEVVTVQKSAATLLVDGLTITMQTLIGMALLAVYHPWLLAFDALLIVAIVIVLFGMARGAVRTSIRESRAKYALVAWLEEIARHLITFKSSPGSTFALSKTDALVGDYITERNKHFRILLRQIAGSLVLQAIASAVLLGVGGWLVINRQLTLGQLIAAEIVVAALVSGFSKFGKQLETFYDLQASIDKLGYLTDLPEERSGTESLTRNPTGASVTLNGVSYAYGSRPAVLSNATWHVEPGARIGLRARGGQGKTTLLELLYGLREPRSGSLQIDGRDYRDLRLGDLRAQIVLIRENEIFEGTVAENIRLGNYSITNDDVRNALRQAGLLDAILTLPNGIHTKVQTGGQPLSTTQSMRLMLARAIAQKPRLLLVDEALDAIDDLRPEGSLCTTLFAGEGAPWTLVLATSNPRLLELCTEIYTINGGQLTPGAQNAVSAR